MTKLQQNTLNKLVGKLEVTDRILITDPCYDKGTWCTEVADLPKGTYNCYVRHMDGRNSAIFLLEEKFDNKGQLFIVDLEHELASCGVDSGQLGFFNQNKYQEAVSKEVFEQSLTENFPYEDWKRTWEEGMSAEDSFYKCCCNHTLNNNRCGIIEGVGFVSGSGYGDGSYPAFYLEDFNGNRVGVQVVFIDEDEDLND